jgi:hypothetical protein
MMLIAIGLSTAVIVGVPVLMYAIDTINTTSQLQEVQLAAEQIHNATRDVDNGITNSTTVDVWIHPGVTVTASANTLTVTYDNSETAPQTWSVTYNHDISIDVNIPERSYEAEYRMGVQMIGNIIHITFVEFPQVVT